jgi:hypothetical protein
VAQSNQLSVDSDHMIGSIEAHLANIDSWRSGDFLIRIRDTSTGRSIEVLKNETGADEFRTVKGPDAMSIVSEMTRIHRVRFDFDQQRLFMANRTERNDQLYDSLDQEIGKPFVRSDDRVIMLQRNKNVGATRLEAAVIHRMEPDAIPTLEEALDQFGGPNIKFIGLAKPAFWSGGYFERKCDMVRKQDDIAEISQVGENRYRVFYRHDVNPQDRRMGLRIYLDWDVKRNVPVKYTAFLGYRAEDYPGATKPFQVGTADWKLINGTNLPVEARISSSSIRRMDGRRFQFEDESTIEIHWFSINEELPDAHFDEQLLHDRQKLDELLNTVVFDEPKSPQTKK